MTFKAHLAHLINQLNNGIRLKQFFVTCNKFPYYSSFLTCLLQNGYIHGYKLANNRVYIYLKYLNGFSLLPGLKYVSRPSGKRYFKKKDLLPLGIYSTDKGITLGFTASKGGELLALIENC